MGMVTAMFMGEYNHSIDAKGRLIIPARFREALGEEFVITRGIDGCLFGYTNEEWKAFSDKLSALPMTNQEARKFARFFLAGASPVELDKQGRILVSPHLRDYAGLEKDVVLVGIGKRIEIWNKATWDGNNEDYNVEEGAASMESLGLSL